MSEKKCPRCQETKPASAEYWSMRLKNGEKIPVGACKECVNAASRERKAQQTPEQIERRRAQVREATAAKRARDRAADPEAYAEALRERQKVWRNENIERNREIQRKAQADYRKRHGYK